MTWSGASPARGRPWVDAPTVPGSGYIVLAEMGSLFV